MNVNQYSMKKKIARKYVFALEEWERLVGKHFYLTPQKCSDPKILKIIDRLDFFFSKLNIIFKNT